MGCAIFMHERASWSESSALRQGIPGMLDGLARESPNCGLITVPGTGRVYFTMVGRTVVILLAGGDKRTQSADIKTALRLARNLEE